MHSLFVANGELGNEFSSSATCACHFRIKIYENSFATRQNKLGLCLVYVIVLANESASCILFT